MDLPIPEARKDIVRKKRKTSQGLNFLKHNCFSAFFKREQEQSPFKRSAAGFDKVLVVHLIVKAYKNLKVR